MKFPMTGQEKCDLSIQVTTWTNLTIYKYILKYFKRSVLLVEKIFLTGDNHRPGASN
jgi:hypothetical protein